MPLNMITELDLKEYKIIYKKHFGQILTDKEALAQATAIINLFRILFKINKNENEKYARNKKL
jgi:hypothetical protein